MNRLGSPNQRILIQDAMLAKEARHFRVFSRAIPKNDALKKSNCANSGDIDDLERGGTRTWGRAMMKPPHHDRPALR